MKLTIANTNNGAFMLQFRDSARLIVDTIPAGTQKIIDIQDVDNFIKQMSVYGMRKYDDLRDPSAFSGLWYRENGVFEIEHLKDAQDAQLGAKMEDLQQLAAATAQIATDTASEAAQNAGLPVPAVVEVAVSEAPSADAPTDDGEQAQQTVQINRKKK